MNFADKTDSQLHTILEDAAHALPKVLEAWRTALNRDIQQQYAAEGAMFRLVDVIRAAKNEIALRNQMRGAA